MVKSLTRADAEEKEEKKEEKADASNGTELDKILTGLDSLASCMDSFGKRMDAFEKRTDAAEKKLDSMSKKDEDKEEKKEEKKEEAKGDAGESKEDAEGEEGEEEKDKPKKVVAESKKDAKKDSVKEDAKADSVVPNAVQAEIKRVESMIPRQLSDAEHRTFASIQERADSVYSAFGDSAPRALNGEEPLQYRRRLAEKLQSHSERAKGVDLTKVAADETAFKVFEDMIYADALVKADTTPDMPAGRFMERVRTDESGRRIKEFRGNGSFVRQFKRPARHVRLNLQSRAS